MLSAPLRETLAKFRSSAGDGTRTRTPDYQAADFKSAASAIPPLRRFIQSIKSRPPWQCPAASFALDVGCLVSPYAGLPSSVRSRSKIAPVSCAKARLTRRALSSRRLSHIRQRAEFSLPCLGVYHWLRTQAPLTPARQGRSSYATFASAHLRHGALASLGGHHSSHMRR